MTPFTSFLNHLNWLFVDCEAVNISYSELIYPPVKFALTTLVAMTSLICNSCRKIDAFIDKSKCNIDEEFMEESVFIIVKIWLNLLTILTSIISSANAFFKCLLWPSSVINLSLSVSFSSNIKFDVVAFGQPIHYD